VPAGTVTGFKSFAKKENINYTIEENLELNNIRKKDAYLLFSDADMIRFVKHAELKKLKIGKDVGMISYDDTPLKEILLGGVSVISTDFENMGRMAAEVILNKDVVHLENPGGFIKRNTL
jgi:DNA-binding LacI/PurR family transcriptional regulator